MRVDSLTQAAYAYTATHRQQGDFSVVQQEQSFEASITTESSRSATSGDLLSSAVDQLDETARSAYEQLERLDPELATLFLAVLQLLGGSETEPGQQLNNLVESVFAATGLDSSQGTSSASEEFTSIRFEATFSSIQSIAGENGSISAQQVEFEFQASFAELRLDTSSATASPFAQTGGSAGRLLDLTT